jgi:hypothetical protein
VLPVQHHQEAAVTDEEEEAAAAPSSTAASRRAARRELSISFRDEASFVAWFREQHPHVTAATRWNDDLRNELQRHSSKLTQPRTTKQLEDSIRASLAAAAGSRN